MKIKTSHILLAGLFATATALPAATTLVQSGEPEKIALAASGKNGPVYQSTAILEVEPIFITDPLRAVDKKTKKALTQTFIKTQLELIIAPETLHIAADSIKLDSRWGEDRKAVLAQLKGMVAATQQRGTDLIEISVKHSKQEEAKAVAKAVLEAYRDRRRDLEMKLRKDQLKAIKMEIDNKAGRVAELHKRLLDIAKEEGVNDIEATEEDIIVGVGNQAGKRDARGIQEFIIARKEYHIARAIMEQMQTKHDIEKTKLKSLPPRIIIHKVP